MLSGTRWVVSGHISHFSVAPEQEVVLPVNVQWATHLLISLEDVQPPPTRRNTRIDRPAPLEHHAVLHVARVFILGECTRQTKIGLFASAVATVVVVFAISIPNAPRSSSCSSRWVFFSGLGDVGCCRCPAPYMLRDNGTRGAGSSGRWSWNGRASFFFSPFLSLEPSRRPPFMRAISSPLTVSG